MGKQIADWLETHWVTPAYAGWLLIGLSLFFFIAATNTLAGWLYVISGISFALLGVAAILPARSLQGIEVSRRSIHPVSVGDPLVVEVVLDNRTSQPKALLQVEDRVPFVMGRPAQTVVETIPAQSSHPWFYEYPTQRRGIYHWHTVQLRTAAPLGLFWCRRSRTVKATAVVYPTVLPLTHCPLVDELGRDSSLRLQHDRRAQIASEGLTRALRPYRWGDPTRMIHWRTSARYGELRVRELEIFTGGQDIVICLDSAMRWKESAIADAFEQAVVVAASVYFYAVKQRMGTKLWTAGTGLLHTNQNVLEALAATQAGEEVQAETLPEQPLIWLTANPDSLNTLPPGSRWVLWSPATASGSTGDAPLVNRDRPGLLIQPDRPLQLQLQSPLSRL